MTNVNKNQDLQQPVEQPKQQKEMSRRQFLSYTLGGTGGFLAASMIAPMLRFAVDPILQKKGANAFVKVAKTSEVKSIPKKWKFKKHVVDGWHAFDEELGAFIAKDKQGNFYALSDICTHLGCTIPSFGSDPAHPKQFACPCHGSHFDIYGKNLIVAPIPLNQYEMQVKNGYIYLGAIHPNTEVQKEEG